MKPTPIVCHACGAKFRAGIERCPRCRTFAPLPVTGPPKPAGPAAKVGGGVLAVLAVAVLVLYASQRETKPPPASSAPFADPFAGRRVPAVTAPQRGGDSAMELRVAPRLIESARLPADSKASADGAAALNAYETAIEQNPQDTEALYGAGRALLRMRRPADAIGPLRQVTGLQPDRWAPAFAYAYACAVAQRWPEAVDAFRRARALGPDDAATSHNLAVSLQKTGDLPGALQEYATAAGLDPTEPATRVGVGVVLDAQGKAAEAVSAYEEALRRLQDGPEAEQVRARIAQLRGQPPTGGA